MAKLVTFAEVLTADHPSSRLYAAGKLPSAPGRLLSEYLEETGGRYEFALPMPDTLRASLRAVAALSNDSGLASAAEADVTMISLEHLRGLDPAATRIIVGQ